MSYSKRKQARKIIQKRNWKYSKKDHWQKIGRRLAEDWQKILTEDLDRRSAEDLQKAGERISNFRKALGKHPVNSPWVPWILWID